MISVRVFLIVLSLLAAAICNAQQKSDPRIADLAAAGRVRFGMFPPQYTKDAATGELKGPYVEVMRELGAHMNLPVVFKEVATPAELIKCLKADQCDVGSLGFDPTRADQVGGFTPPFMQVDYTYLVPAGSRIGTVADADTRGVRIAVVRDHASTLALRRIIKNATLVSADTPDDAFALLQSRQADVYASVRPALLNYSTRLSGSHVLADNFGFNSPALVVPKGRPDRLAYMSEFVEAAKASGLIKRAIERAGQPGYRVAPTKRLRVLNRGHSIVDETLAWSGIFEGVIAGEMREEKAASATPLTLNPAVELFPAFAGRSSKPGSCHPATKRVHKPLCLQSHERAVAFVDPVAAAKLL
jgi:polar amino acid transport system substrate-binding protein